MMKGNILGGGDHDNWNKTALGQDGHGLPPQWLDENSTNQTSNDTIIGKDGHGLPPAWLNDNSTDNDTRLGKDGHGLPPAWLDDNSTNSTSNETILGKDGHGQWIDDPFKNEKENPDYLDAEEAAWRAEVLRHQQELK